MADEVFLQQDWDAYAECYNSLLRLQPYRQLIDEVLAQIQPQGTDRILDAGCGTGNLLHAIRGKQQEARLYGVDLSPSMLALCTRTCADDEVTLVQSSLDAKLPFDDGAFTKVVSVNVLYALPRPDHTLRELHRVLQDGGMLVLETPKKGYDNGLVLKAHCKSTHPDQYWMNAHASPQREEMLIKEAIPDAALAEQMLTIAAYNRRIAQTAVFHFYQEGELAEVLRTAGFTLRTLTPAYAQQGMLATATKGEIL